MTTAEILKNYINAGREARKIGLMFIKELDVQFTPDGFKKIVKEYHLPYTSEFLHGKSGNYVRIATELEGIKLVTLADVDFKMEDE